MEAGLIITRSNDELDEIERREREAHEQAEQQREQVESQLASHIRRRFETMRRYKEPIEERMLQSLRQLTGRYSQEKSSEIQSQGLPLIYMQLTGVKSRAAKSWIRDVLMPAGDKPWQMSPTTDPSLNEEEEQMVMQRVQSDAQEFMQVMGQQITPDQMQNKFEQVRDKVNEQRRKHSERKLARMEEVIESQLVEGNWSKQFHDVISDVVDFPAGILKGPVMRRQKRLSWATGQMDVAEEIVPEVERVDPFSFYTMPGAEEVDDNDICQIHEYQPDDLYDLIGLPGYDEPAIRRVLENYEIEGTTHWTRDALRSSKEHARGHFSGTEKERDIIEAIEFWGSVQGRKLLDWGMDEMTIDDPERSYDVMAAVIGSEVVCVRLNPDPLGRKPFAKACFEQIPGSFWGKGVPDLLRDCQDVCNAAARALVANMGISSGPQVAINTNSVAPGEDIETIYPWKIWQLDFSKTGQSSRAPMDFFQPNSMTRELMAVYQEFSQLADEYSGIPSYTHGLDDNKGAGATASGLSMLMNAASKAIKNVIKHIDKGITEPIVHRYYVHNMLWNDDEAIKGDAQVVARGAMSLVAKEQNQMRLQELLQQTANPIDQQILGMKGRATMLRHALEGVDVGADDLVPNEDELQRRQMMQAMQEQQQQGGQGQQMGQGQQATEQRPDGAPAGVRTA